MNLSSKRILLFSYSATTSLKSTMRKLGVGVAVGAAVFVGLGVLVGLVVFVGFAVLVAVGVSEAAAVSVANTVCVGVAVGMFNSFSMTTNRFSKSSWICVIFEMAAARLSSVISPAALKLVTTTTTRTRARTTISGRRRMATSLSRNQLSGQWIRNPSVRRRGPFHSSEAKVAI